MFTFNVSGSEKITTGELEGLTREVVSSGALLDFHYEGKEPREQLRANLSSNANSLDGFLVSLGEGLYDSSASKSKVQYCLYCALNAFSCTYRCMYL